LSNQHDATNKWRIMFHVRVRPDWRKLVKAPEYHTSAYWRGLRRTIAGSVSIGREPLSSGRRVGDADVKGRKPMQTGVVNGWRCRYDLQTGKFDVPALFSSDNAKAVVPE
jgi:hypothetical protein